MSLHSACGVARRNKCRSIWTSRFCTLMVADRRSHRGRVNSLGSFVCVRCPRRSASIPLSDNSFDSSCALALTDRHEFARRCWKNMRSSCMAVTPQCCSCMCTSACCLALYVHLSCTSNNYQSSQGRKAIRPWTSSNFALLARYGFSGKSGSSALNTKETT